MTHPQTQDDETLPEVDWLSNLGIAAGAAIMACSVWKLLGFNITLQNAVITLGCGYAYLTFVDMQRRHRAALTALRNHEGRK